MTREDINRMAREAGFVGFDGSNAMLRKFADLVAAAERNACAQMVEPVDETLADEIRARGEK